MEYQNEDIIEKYLSIYPTSKHLFFFIRKLLRNLKMTDCNGLNTISLFLLIIAYLQIDVNENSDKILILGKQLIGFF